MRRRHAAATATERDPRPGPAPAGGPTGPLLELQRQAGNKAVAAALASIGAVRAPTTPDGELDRIPPRIDVPAAVTLANLAKGGSVTLRAVPTASGPEPGQVLVNGAPSAELTGTATVSLKGTTQTMYGAVNRLRLVAEQRGKTIGESPPFAVAAVPVGVDMRLDQEFTSGELRGMSVTTALRSDSGDRADLDNAPFMEMIETSVQDGCFANVKTDTSDYTKSDVDNHDRHRVKASLLTSPGLWDIKQTHVYKNRRTGSADIPMAASGFSIRMVMMGVPGGKSLFFIVTKRGAALTSRGVASTPGAGAAQTRQDINP